MSSSHDAELDLEAAMFAALEGEVTYEIEADVLTFRSGEDGLVLRADKSCPRPRQPR